MNSLIKVLMDRDGMTQEEAEKEVDEARKEIMELIGEGDMPFDYCEERWGLEPDYLEELIF